MSDRYAEGYRAGLRDAERKCREACARWVETFRVAIVDALDGRLPSASNDGAVAANECADAIRALAATPPAPAPTLDVAEEWGLASTVRAHRARHAPALDAVPLSEVLAIVDQWAADSAGEGDGLDEVLRELRAHLEHYQFAQVLPGDPIVECSCPCCGAVLDVTHGDDEGEISVVGHMPPCAACEVEAASGSDYNRQHTCERDANRAPCPTCDGEGGWLEADSPNPSAEMQHSECPDCHGHGTLDARALQAMVLEFRAAADNGGYQAGIATAARFVADEMRDGMTPDSLSHQIMRLLVDPSEHMCPTDNFHPLLAECALYIDGALMGERRRTLRDRLTIALAPSAGREGGEHE